MNHLPYWAAISADSIFSAELERAYGKEASERRYYPTHTHTSPDVLVALRQKLQADEARRNLNGPAVADEALDDWFNEGGTVYDQNRLRVAEVFGDIDIDAPLIAASPRLRKALQDLVDDFDAAAAELNFPLVTGNAKMRAAREALHYAKYGSDHEIA